MESPSHPLRILVADDEESMRHFLLRGLQRIGHSVTVAADGDAAYAAWTAQPFDLAVLDLRMPGADGAATLARIRSHQPDAVVLMMSAHGTIDAAVEAMHQGAADFVTKPFTIDELHLRIDRAARLLAVDRENRELRAMVGRSDQGLDLCAHSPAMREVVRQAELAAASDSTVLLTGESGTGKGLLAKALHLRSPRRAQPFLALNCAAVPDALLESELFGHEAGAFTGARQRKAGLLQRCDGGTLFLDEVGDMALPAQAKIERFLVDREFVPLGGEQPVKVDVRIVAATNRDLQALVQAGRFRPELLWRVDVVSLRLPALRERRDDVPALIARFLARHGKDGAPQHRLSPEALAVLSAYHWPGNVRELENLVERMVVLAGLRRELGLADLPAELQRGHASETATTAATDDRYEAARERFDRLYFQNLLRRAGGNVSEAARLAGISRGHLHRRLRDLGEHSAAIPVRE